MRKVEVVLVVIGALGTNSNKALWKMHRKIRLGHDDWSITETLFTWNDENNLESVGYEMKKKPQYLRPLVGVCYCGIFYQEITFLRVKELIIIT